MFHVRLLRLLIFGIVGTTTASVVAIGIVGYFVYSQSRVDPIRQVDAIIVLGGEHDGREEYGFELARQGVARNVVLSDPSRGSNEQMNAFCKRADPGFSVFCFTPIPGTTRGEAQYTRDLARRRGWTSVMVISWRYHLPRARYIFDSCLDGDVVMRSVPRNYDLSLADWFYTYLYQTVGFGKAVVQGRC